jgi:hypothetical protein
MGSGASKLKRHAEASRRKHGSLVGLAPPTPTLRWHSSLKCYYETRIKSLLIIVYLCSSFYKCSIASALLSPSVRILSRTESRHRLPRPWCSLGLCCFVVAPKPRGWCQVLVSTMELHITFDARIRELSYFGNRLIIRNRLCLTSSGLEVMRRNSVKPNKAQDWISWQ